MGPDQKWLDERFLAGQRLLQNGSSQAALEVFCELQAHLPGNPMLLGAIGLCQRQLGDAETAVSTLRRAIVLGGDTANTNNNLGNALLDVSDADGAISALERSLELQPGFVPALANLGRALLVKASVLIRDGHLRAAHDVLSRVLKVDPESSAAHFNLGQIARANNEIERAKALYRRAAVLAPDHQASHWAAALTLPVLYSTDAEVEQARQRFVDGLGVIADGVELKTDEQKQGATEAARSRTNFQLAYQGHDDRHLQEQYGAMLTRIMATAPLPTAKSRHGVQTGGESARVTVLPPHHKSVRVGFVCRFEHTVGKLFSGWLGPAAGIDKVVYHSGPRADSMSERIASHVTAFHHITGGMNAVRAAIEADKPDILVYPELGMDPDTLCLAAIRMAPVQCVSWGHPITSGLSSMDYFLSSQLMEPLGAEKHYSEKLTKLPGISICYAKPDTAAVPSRSRQFFSLGDDEIVYGCVQSLFKYLPCFDHVWPQICRRVDGARLVFLANKSKAVTDQFRRRLEVAFEHAGMNHAEHTLILPKLKTEDFLALLGVCDVYLDSLGWSGGNTTLEALAWGLPMVSWAGPWMRSRHTCAIIAQSGCAEGVTASINEYIELAARFGNHPDARQALTEGLRRGSQLVYNDRAGALALDDFLRAIPQRR